MREFKLFLIVLAIVYAITALEVSSRPTTTDRAQVERDMEPAGAALKETDQKQAGNRHGGESRPMPRSAPST